MPQCLLFTQVAALDTNATTRQPEVFPSNVLRLTFGEGASMFATVETIDNNAAIAGNISFTAPVRRDCWGARIEHAECTQRSTELLLSAR